MSLSTDLNSALARARHSTTRARAALDARPPSAFVVMYAHILSSAGVRDDTMSETPPATSEPRARRQSAIGGTPPPAAESEKDRHGILAPSLGAVGFASTENLAEIMPYLNRSLAELGYPSPLELLLPNAGDLARTCNAIFLMLRDRQDDVTARDEWAAERRRLQSDLARAETHVHRVKSERDAKDHELLSLRAKHERALAAARQPG